MVDIWDVSHAVIQSPANIKTFLWSESYHLFSINNKVWLERGNVISIVFSNRKAAIQQHIILSGLWWHQLLQFPLLYGPAIR